MQKVYNIDVTSLEVEAGALVKQEMMTKQLCSKQDHTALGSYINPQGHKVIWGATFDGHGGDPCIEAIRRAHLDEIMKSDAPHIELQNFIDGECQKFTKTQQYKSGATCIYAKVTITDLYIEIKITNIGDSRAILFVNGEPVFVSDAHTSQSGREMVRLLAENRVSPKTPLINEGTNFDMLSSTSLMSKRGTYVNFMRPDGLNVLLSTTQSLGHMSLTGISPDITTFKIKPTDTFKIFLMSDGVTDVIPVDGFMCAPSIGFYQQAASAETVVLEAEHRWKQTWKYYGSTDLTMSKNTSFPTNGYDDCCCVMLERIPIVVELSLDTPSLDPVSITNIEDDDIYA